MRTWSPEQIAQAAGVHLVAAPQSSGGPERVTIDSRDAGPGSLFVGLKGATHDGGKFAPTALDGGAWGVLTTPAHAQEAARGKPGVLLAAEDPLLALQRLATAWRRGLGVDVIGVTGSTGKTSTKDILAAILLSHRRTVASRANFNTEIGLPLEILGAPQGTEVLVLEMAMRGPGQIAELASIAEPSVGVIVTIGPVHLELLGSIEAIAAAKAELIAGLPAGGTAIVPVEEPLLEPHLRDDLETITFGAGGADVRIVRSEGDQVVIDLRGEELQLEVPFTQAHLRTNLLAAVAAAKAVGVTPSGRVELNLSPGRGQRLSLPGGLTLIDDCYNANPMSMRAALDELSATAGENGLARRVAVLGDMLELGPREREFHVEIGEHAQRTGVDVLITVGGLAQAMTEGFDGEAYPVGDATEAASLALEVVQPGDVILVKASRGIGLELVCAALSSGGGDG